VLNWEAIGAIGEVLGAIAVVATLLYLAVQIRQNAQSVRNAASLSVNEGLAEINRRLSNDPEFAELWLRGLKDYRGLTEVERARFAAYALDILNLAVYVDNVTKTTPQGGRTTNVHINYVKYITRLIRENPGLRQFLDSLEKRWVGPEDLFERFLDDA
jgi:hypothetical protein